jgi:predicted Zn finger-like uncharacterized protein
MDVRCDRCGTEYEFDDALISERGTTVQCTECGSKFKVFPHQGAGVPEHWVVRGGGSAGWETHFSSLRDLQAAIVRGAVGPTDTISRGAEPPRPLSSIAELEQLFAERKKFGGTLAGVAPQAAPPVTTRGVAPEHAARASAPLTGSRAPEPPTEAMPAKRRVNTKMGLPTPVDAPPGFRSVSSPPPELTPDLPHVVAQPAAPLTGSHAPVRPLERTLMSPSGASHAPRVPAEAPAPARTSDLARTQRSAESAPPGFAPAPAPAPAPGNAGFGATMPSFGAPTADTGFASPVPHVTTGAPAQTQNFAQTLPSHSSGFGSGQHVISKSPVPTQSGGEAVSPPRQRIVSALSFGDAQSTHPPAASAPTDAAPTFAKTMLGMSHAPAPPAAAAPAAPPLTPLPPAAVPSPPQPAQLHHTQPMASMQQPAPQAPPVVAQAPYQAPPYQASQQTAPMQATPMQASPQVAPQPAFQQPVQAQARVTPPALPQPSDDEDLDQIAGVPRRRGLAKVLVAIVVLGAGGLAAATVGRPTIERFFQSKPAPTNAPAVDVGPLLTKARELVQAGDLDGARKNLENAAAQVKLAGSQNPSVAREIAQVDVLAAEVEGLRLLLAAKEDTTRVDEAKKALDERLARARTSVAEAARSAASEPDVVRAQMSLARLSGDRTSALARKAALPASSSDASSRAADAYALAALDLSDTPPKYGEAIQRLGPAAPEGHLGLARSALIYALVGSGDRVRAAEELKLLDEQVPDISPLYVDVVAFAKREGVSAEAAGAASAAPSAVPLAPGSAEPAPGAPPAPAAPGAPGGDFRTRLQRGSEALSRGDTAKADTFYRSVVQEMPGNTEAVAGLAEVARRRGQSAEAARLYDQVLQSNPSYLPALVGRADMLWASGERSQALKLYRRVIDQAGTSNSYGKHAQERINAADADRAPAPRETTPSAPAPSPAPTTETPSGIDTTDLQ